LPICSARGSTSPPFQFLDGLSEPSTDGRRLPGISTGRIFRRVNRFGKIWGEGITPKAIWHVVKAAALRAGIQNLAPHYLRSTCARLCHVAGGELEQIQFLLGDVRFRLRSVIWAANRNYATPSTTNLASRTLERSVMASSIRTSGQRHRSILAYHFRVALTSFAHNRWRLPQFTSGQLVLDPT
jgi:hypothetical protein